MCHTCDYTRGKALIFDIKYTFRGRNHKCAGVTKFSFQYSVFALLRLLICCDALQDVVSHITRDKTPRDIMSRYTCNCHAAGPGGGDTAATHGAVSRYVTVTRDSVTHDNQATSQQEGGGGGGGGWGSL